MGAINLPKNLGEIGITIDRWERFMSGLTLEEAKNCLFGSEHSANYKTIYGMEYAVGKQYLGVSFTAPKVNSGFSFGLSQLDIGGNPTAQAAYSEVLYSASHRVLIRAYFCNSRFALAIVQGSLM